jgi:hypothetical protein
MICKIIHIKLKTELHEPYEKPRVNSCALEVWAVPVPLVAPIIVFFSSLYCLSFELLF